MEKDNESNAAVNPSFTKFVYGEQSLLEWIKTHSDEKGLKEDLPDEDSLNFVFPELSEIRPVDGMIDGVLGEEKGELAQPLLEMFLEFSKFLTGNAEEERTDFYLGKIYHYTITHRTMSYIDAFLELLRNNIENEELLRTCAFTARMFLDRGIHREAVKFGIAVYGVFNFDDEYLESYCAFGLADEFATFVGLALQRKERNAEIFELIKLVKGWGRIAYLRFLQVEDEEIRKWLIFEGYQCEIGIDHVVVECLEKSDMIGFIKENGFDERLYDVCGEMLDALDSGKASFEDYAHSKELVCLFLEESQTRNMNLKRFAIICNLFDYVKSEAFTEDESKKYIAMMSEIAYERGIDWVGFIKSNPLDYHARIIAKRIGFDVFDDVLLAAKNNQHFDDWYVLANVAQNAENFKKVCALAGERFDLESLKKEPKDELGFGSAFKADNDLSFIVQFLDRFDELLGVELVETLLQSPVTRCRNMALKAIEHWQEKEISFPKNLLEIIEKNQTIEPNENVKERCQKILEKSKTQENPCKFDDYLWCLQVWGEFGSSGIWLVWDKEQKKRRFVNVDYETLGLPEELKREFQSWQGIFDRYGVEWSGKKVPLVLENIREAFEETGLQLAKKLKMFFKEKAYVEISLNGKLQEIKIYYLESEFFDLCDEKGEIVTLEEIEEELGISFNQEKSAEVLEGICALLDKKGEHFEALDEEKIKIADAMQEKKQELIIKLRGLLPKYCCVEVLE